MNAGALLPSVPLRARAWVRSALILVAFLVGAYLLGERFDRTHPASTWLVWRYLQAWAATGIFVLSSLSVGYRVVTALSTPGENTDGMLTLSFATGVYVFFLAVFVAGVTHHLDTKTFFLLPALLFAIGARRLVRDGWLYYLRVRAAKDRFKLTLPEGVALAIGVIGLVVVFVPTLSPGNMAYDALWYHLPLAEQYSIAGAIHRFPEGWLAGAIPHLASVLYTWAFIAPYADMFDKVTLCSQLEFAVFLFTLAGIPWLVRSVLPGSRARFSWVLFFAFPAIFVYDSLLSVAADHIGALWSIPVYVTMLRALRELRPRACLLFVLQLSGLMMTKYTSSMCVVFPLLMVLGRAAQLAYRKGRGRTPYHGWFFGPLTALVGGLALTSPHWLKNLIWYGDPIYPMLHAHLKLRPWIPDGAYLYEVFTKGNFSTQGSWGDKLAGAWIALYDHSYAMYSFETFHHSFPVFGSLLTFSLVALPFLKAPRSVWGLVIAIHVGVGTWYIFFHEDRYLQAILPWMVAASAAIIRLAWKNGLMARAGATCLIGVQLVGGVATIFWPTHAMTGKSPLGGASDFFGQTMSGDFTSRTRPFEDMAKIGRDVPPGSKILIHREHMRLGLGVPSVNDSYRIQYGLSYGYLGSSAAVYRKLREYGVTHVLWTPEATYGDSSVAAELVFHSFVTRHLVDRKTEGGRILAALPKQEPKEEGHLVFYFNCGGYPSGLFELADMTTSPILLPDRDPPKAAQPREKLDGNAEALIARATYAVSYPICPGAPALNDFQLVARWGAAELMVRR